MTLNLTVIIASTRPNRAGLPIANWFIERAKKHDGFDVVVADLHEIALPMLTELHKWGTTLQSLRQLPH